MMERNQRSRFGTLYPIRAQDFVQEVTEASVESDVVVLVFKGRSVSFSSRLNTDHKTDS